MRGRTPVVEAVAVPSNRSTPASSSSGVEADGGEDGRVVGGRFGELVGLGDALLDLGVRQARAEESASGRFKEGCLQGRASPAPSPACSVVAMADGYELQLNLDLPDSLSPRDLDLLRWHLGEEDGQQDAGYEYPLWDDRGPASRIGGVQVGELRSVHGGWALTVRQQAHPDQFHDLRRIVRWLGARTTTWGAIGYLRSYESHMPDVLFARSGAVRCVVLQEEKVVSLAEVM